MNHLDGPMIVISRSQVLTIRYQNGMVERMDESPTAAPAPTPAPAQTHTPAPRQAQAGAHNNQPVNQTAPGEIPAIPILGEVTYLQHALNDLPAVPIGRNNLKFRFGGDVWIATNNGRNFLAGTISMEATNEGFILILTQTHIYPPRDVPRINWVKTSGLEIALEYKVGPPPSLRAISRPQSNTNTNTAQANNNRSNTNVQTVINPYWFNSIGASIGVSMTPLLTCSLHTTLAVSRKTFFDIGFDIGWFDYKQNSYHKEQRRTYNNWYYDEHSYDGKTKFNSTYTYIRYNLSTDFDEGLWYFGVGAGYAYLNYDITDRLTHKYSDYFWPHDSDNSEEISGGMFLTDFTTGLIIHLNRRNHLLLSYSLRTNFDYTNGKFAVGYLYRVR